MTTSIEIARSRVAAEDAKKLESRIAQYQREIDRALGSVLKAQEAGEQMATLTYSTHERDEADRVREALTELGYKCGEAESRQGEWTNGYGYTHYLAIEVQYNKTAH